METITEKEQQQYLVAASVETAVGLSQQQIPSGVVTPDQAHDGKSLQRLQYHHYQILHAKMKKREIRVKDRRKFIPSYLH